MPALTESEATARAGLITVVSYDVRLDLTVTPARSRTDIRFRCAEPGAESFAELAAVLAGEGAVLNGVPAGPVDDGRLALPGLAAENLLTVEAEVVPGAIAEFTDPVDGARYVMAFCYPTSAPELFCCFDQLDLPAPLTLSLRAPAGWECVANGVLADRPLPGAAGAWRFAPIRMKPLEVAFCAGPWRAEPVSAAPGSAVTLTSYRRAALAAVTHGQLGRFCEIASDAVDRHGRTLGVPCAYPKYDIVAFPGVPFRAASIPGLMLVGEDELARLADPDDDFTAMIAAHEVAHLWFGCQVGMRWWDDLWLEESLATYLSYRTDAGWASFAYGEKPRALRTDELPITRPVASPVATLAEALDRPNAITYVKGTAVVRQLAALIGEDAVTRGLGDYLTRFSAAGTARLDDLVACWSRAYGSDLAGWADEWLRTKGTPVLTPRLTAAADGTIAALSVTQDIARTHRVGVALYDTAEVTAGTARQGTAPTRLRHRRTVYAELSATVTEVPGLTGDRLPAAVVVNAGDWALAQVTIDDRSLAALAGAAFRLADPLTEAACWNAAWHMVLAGEMPAADYARLVARRLADERPPAGRGNRSGQLSAGPAAADTATAGPDAAASPLTPSAAEALLGHALMCADRYVPRPDRDGLRALIADAALTLARRTGPGGGALRRAVLPAFAACAQAGRHVAVIRAVLDGEDPPDEGPRRDEPPPAGYATLTVDVAADLTLRAAFVKALAVLGLASDADLDSLTAADPVAGGPPRATCAAARPDPRAKEAAWTAALAEGTSQRLAAAHAEGIWIPGQEPHLAGYRDRYFSEALPALSARDAAGDRRARRLAGTLFPVIFADATTLAATRAALDGQGLTPRLSMVLAEAEAEMRTAVAVSNAAAAPAPQRPRASGQDALGSPQRFDVGETYEQGRRVQAGHHLPRRPDHLRRRRRLARATG